MTTDAVGGVWHYALELAGLLAERDAEVLLATMGPEPSDEQRAEAANVPGLDLRTSTYALEWMPDAWNDVRRAGAWLHHLEGDAAPDVIHLNGFVHASLPWRVPVTVVAHSDVVSWWHAVHRMAPPPEWNRYVSGVTAGLRSAHQIVAPSAAMRSALVRHYACGENARVIPNCRRPDAWMPGIKEHFVLTAGRAWDRAKNIAACDVAAERLPWPFKFAGDIAGPSADEAVFRHLELLGPMKPDALAGLMSRAAIYALPARYEPFGLSVLEAALCGCALILGDIESFRENWDGAALFVNPDRPDELRRAIEALIARPEQRTTLGAAARRRGEEFSPQRHGDAYYELYLEMVQHRGRLVDSPRPL